MALKDTVAKMDKLLEAIAKDMGKATTGNKAASQRVRTNTIKFEKIAKKFRKESVAAGKKGGKKKATKKKAPAKKVAKKKVVKKKAPAKKKVAKKKAPAKRRATAKVVRKKKRR